MKCSFDSLAAKFVCKDPESNAMLIKNEYVKSICAFPPDGMIMHVSPTDLIVTRNWKVTKYIADPNSGNAFKFWLSILPVYDIDECPFVVSSGEVSFNLTNV